MKSFFDKVANILFPTCSSVVCGEKSGSMQHLSMEWTFSPLLRSKDDSWTPIEMTKAEQAAFMSGEEGSAHSTRDERSL